MSPSAIPSVRTGRMESQSWLQNQEVFRTLQILIGYCLSQAARATTDKSKEWIKLAEAAECNDDMVEIVIRFGSSAEDLDVKPDSTEKVRRQVNGRLKRLESFILLAEGVASKWREELQSLSSSALEN